MAFCRNCGTQMNDNDMFCTACGANQAQQPGQNAAPNTAAAPDQSYINDTGHIGWGILGFFIPLAGLILFLVWMEDQPKNSKMAGKGALIGVIAGVAITVLCYVLMFAIWGVALWSMY